MRLRSDLLPITALIPIAYLILGCGDGPAEPRTDGGRLEVSTVSIGSAIDPDGYSVVLNGAGSLAIDANGLIAVSNIAPEQFPVELTDLAADCQVIGENPETVTVEADEITSISFEVSCPPFHDHIAFSSGSDLWVMEAGQPASSRPRASVNLTPDSTWLDSYPAWAPDGTRIAFTRQPWPSGSSHDIYILNTATMSVSRVTNDGDVLLSSWSPDGTRIVYDSGDDIYVINADGTNPVNLTPGPTRGYHPAWSPDGRQIAFTLWQRVLGRTTADIWTMGSDGSNPIRVTDLQGFPAHEPAWSPDGSRIAFSGPSTNADNNIWVVNADGSNLTRLTEDVLSYQAWRPSWSPDGTRIVYWAYRPDDGHCYEIYVMRSDGSNPTNLTDHESCDTDPAWSPGQ